MARKKEAYVWWNAGTCHVVQYPSQVQVCQGKTFGRVVAKARCLGYHVRVYADLLSDESRRQLPVGARDVTLGGYTLPPVRRHHA